MAAAADERLDSLFEQLNECATSQQHKKAIRIADEILAIAPKDTDALTCKVVATIQVGNYDAALALIAKHPTLASSMVFEKAYCLYRSGRIQEALEVAQAGEASNPEACLQLQAQLHYRLHQCRESIQAYDRLFKEHKVESLQLKINVVASYVAAELSGEVPGLMSAMQVTSKQSFELGYNKACALLAQGDFAAAETELRLAIKLGGEALFEEECSEDEVAEELAPLTVQLGYVLARLGRLTEAQEMYEQVLANTAVTEEVVRAVAHNNMLAASGKMEGGAANKKGVANAAKRLEGMLDRDKPAPLKLSSELEARLAPSQKQALHVNRALLYLLAGRYDAARDAAAAVARQYGDSSPLVLLRAALLSADGKAVEADAALQQYSAANPSSALNPTLMRTQLALEAGGSPAKALEILSSLQGPDEVVYSGAMLATRLALYQQLGDVAGAEAMLDAALVYWRKQAVQPPASTSGATRGRGTAGASGADAAGTALGWCLQGLVGLKLRLGKVQEAVQCYQALQQSGAGGAGAGGGSQSAAVLGRLIRALAVQDAAGAVRMEAQLPGVSAAEVRGVDVDALEQFVRGGAGSTFKRKEARKRDGEDMDVEQQQKKKKQRKRKPRLPKGYNPELPNGGLPPPDPERWLPKWQRAEFKRRKVTSAQRKNEVVKGSQGAGKVDESLDRSKAALPSQETKQQPKAAPSLPARKGKGKK